MRAAVILGLLLTSSVAKADPWAALDRRRAWLGHDLPLRPADDGRGKPDEVGVYDLLAVDVALAFEGPRLPAEAEFAVTLSATQALQVVPLLAVAYAPLAVSQDGADVEFSYSAQSFELLIFPGRPLRPGEPTTFEISAALEYACADDTACASDGRLLHLVDLGWYPLSYDAPLTDRFEFGLRATAPGPFGVAATGARLDAPGTWAYRTELPTIAGALAVGDYDVRRSDPIELFAPRGAVNGGRPIEAAARSALAVYDRFYAPYPFSRLGVAAIPDAANAAIGPQANIMLPDGLWFIAPDDVAAADVARVVAHEIGHQYFFNLIAVLDDPEAWLSEGWAEYSSLRVSATRDDASAHRSENYWGYLLTVGPNEDAPLWSAEVRQSPRYFEIVYLKGSVVVDMLAAQIGRDRFDALLRDYVATFRGQITTTPELEDFLAERAGRGIVEPFFRQWIYDSGFPTIEARAEPARNDQTPAQLTLSQPGDRQFAGPLPLRYRVADGEPVDLIAELRPGRYGFDVAGAQGVQIDPDLTLLRRVRPQPATDVDLSGVVDGTDLLDVWASVGRQAPEPGYRDQVDVNGDLVVDERDARAVIEAFGAGW